MSERLLLDDLLRGLGRNDLDLSVDLDALAHRFWSHVDRNGDCWVWRLSTTRYGHGRFTLGFNVGIPAHRFSWYLTHGPIPDGLWVLHRCDNPPCVRPDHLFLGTHQDNVDDMVAKGRNAPLPVRRGLENSKTKVTPEIVVAIREEYARGGISQETLGKKYGLSQGHVSKVILGHSHVAQYALESGAST